MGCRVLLDDSRLHLKGLIWLHNISLAPRCPHPGIPAFWHPGNLTIASHLRVTFFQSSLHSDVHDDKDKGCDPAALHSPFGHADPLAARTHALTSESSNLRRYPLFFLFFLLFIRDLNVEPYGLYSVDYTAIPRSVVRTIGVNREHYMVLSPRSLIIIASRCSHLVDPDRL